MTSLKIYKKNSFLDNYIFMQQHSDTCIL